MSIQDFGNTVQDAKVVSLTQQQQTLQNAIGGFDPADVIEVRLNGRSSINARLSYGGDRPLMTFFQDRNKDGQLSTNERIATATSVGETADEINATGLDPTDTYYLNVLPTSTGESSYFLSLSSSDSSPSSESVSNRQRITSPRKWNASFLNRDDKNLTNYANYDFSRPDATADLGSNGKKRKTVAQLNIDYGMGSPAGIQRDEFVMEAWTRVRLKSGKYYRLSSASDDGMRFLFRDRKTGETLIEFNDNWVDRSVNTDPWSQVFTVSESNRYDFYVQYYEDRGASVIDVALEKLHPQGQVQSAALNVRSTPSTLNNTPLATLSEGDTFKIRRLVESPNDSVYQNWFKVVAEDNGQKVRGYVAAGSNFVDIVGEVTDAVTIGKDIVEQPAPPDDTITPSPPGSGTKGVITSSVWITSDDKISIRSDKSISGVELGRVGQGTSLDVIEMVSGGRYLNSFDAWYRVRVNLNGRDQEGYVAAYYVDVLNDGRYGTGISKTNGAYKAHLDEVLTPTYYTTSYRPYIDQAAARYSWLQPSVIAGIGSRESAWGRILSPRGPSGTGDGGHGRGLMQIDDRFHQTFIGSGLWRNPKSNIDYGIDEVLAKNYAYLDANTSLQGTDLLRGALASYNAGLSSITRAIREGRDVDYYTTGQDYSWDVLNRAGWFQLHGWQ